jgi:acid stress-induced BolA-like protein IbaG/YrbA
MEADLKERLHAVLATAAVADPEIEVTWDGYKVVGAVVSSTFEGINEAERQALIWDALEQMSMEERLRVAFVFTDTPEERAEEEAEQRAADQAVSETAAM